MWLHYMMRGSVTRKSHPYNYGKAAVANLTVGQVRHVRPGPR